jgi:gas vesicle protein
LIVHPNFLDHWKTRLLVKITRDESCVLAVLRLWSHCQNSHRNIFPDMTPAQLASICHWGKRKPSCHVALVKSGFVDRLTPKGFAAHQWDQHNRQLFQKWAAGEKGGRKRKDKNANDLPLSEEPVGYRPPTDRVPDKTRPDQTRSDLDETRPDQTRPESPAFVSSSSNEDPRTEGRTEKLLVKELVGGLVGRTTALQFRPPTEAEVRHYLCLQFNGAEEFAGPFLKAMQKQKWRSSNGQIVGDWRAVAKKYASNAELKRRGL